MTNETSSGSVQSGVGKDPPGIDATKNSRNGDGMRKGRSRSKSKSNTGSTSGGIKPPVAPAPSSSPSNPHSLSKPNKFDRVLSSMLRGCETKIADAAPALIPGAQCGDISSGDFDLGRLDDLAEDVYASVYTRFGDGVKASDFKKEAREGGTVKENGSGSTLKQVRSADTFGSNITGLTLTDEHTQSARPPPQKKKVEVETPREASFDEDTVQTDTYDDEEECTLHTMGTGATGITGGTGLTGGTEPNSLLVDTLNVLDTIEADDNTMENEDEDEDEGEGISRASTFETSYTLNTLNTVSTLGTGLGTNRTMTTNGTDVQRQIGWSAGSKASMAVGSTLGTVSEAGETTTTKATTDADDNGDWDHSYSNPKNRKKEGKAGKNKSSSKSKSSKAVNTMAAIGADELDELVAGATAASTASALVAVPATSSPTGTPSTIHVRSLQSINTSQGDRYALSTEDLEARQRTRSSLHTTGTGYASQKTEQTDHTLHARNTSAASAAAVGAGVIMSVRSQSSKVCNESIVSNDQSVGSNLRSHLGSVASVEVEFGKEPGKFPTTAVDLDASDCEDDGSDTHSKTKSESMVSLDGLEAIVNNITTGAKYEIKKEADERDLLGIKTVATDVSIAAAPINEAKGAIISQAVPAARASESMPVDFDDELFTDVEDANEADESFEVELGSEPYRFQDHDDNEADEDANDAEEADEQSVALASAASKNMSDQSESTMTSVVAKVPRARSLRFSRSKESSIVSALSEDKNDSCRQPIAISRVVTADEICRDLGCIGITMSESSSFDEPVISAEPSTPGARAEAMEDVEDEGESDGDDDEDKGEEINFAQFQQTLEVDRTCRIAELLEEVYGPTPNSNYRASKVIAKFDGRIDVLVETLQGLKNHKTNNPNDDPRVTGKKSTRNVASRRSAKSSRSTSNAMTKKPPSSVPSASSAQKSISTKRSKKSFPSFFKSSSKSKKKSNKASPLVAQPATPSNYIKDIDLKIKDGRSSTTINGGSVQKTVATADSAESADVLNTTGETTGLLVDEGMTS